MLIDKSSYDRDIINREMAILIKLYCVQFHNNIAID